MNNIYYKHPNSLNPYGGHNTMYHHGHVFSSNYGNMYHTGYTTHRPYTQGYASPVLNDYGKEPFVVNINQAAKHNNTFRTAIWSGDHLQVTLMSINVGENIGLEVHPHTDQFLRIEEGQGYVEMGKSRDRLDFVRHVYDDCAIMVPAGTWHNVTNTGHVPLKLYSIYAPPEHPFGTVHSTKAVAERS